MLREHLAESTSQRAGTEGISESKAFAESTGLEGFIRRPGGRAPPGCGPRAKGALRTARRPGPLRHAVQCEQGLAQAARRRRRAAARWWEEGLL
jgi:hypothetical protein